MEINEYTHYLIEDYLEGQLQGTALQEFEARMKAEPDFAQEVQLYKEMAQAFDDPEVLKLEQKLERIGDTVAKAYQAQQKEKPKAKIRLLSNWRTWAAAASIALLVLATWLISRSPSAENLYAAYYEDYPETVQVRSADEQATSVLSEGMKAYQQGDYTTALTTFQALLPKEGNLEEHKTTLHFYTGLAYMGQENYQEALGAFQKVISAESSLVIQPAHWYSALTHLRLGDEEACKAALVKVLEVSQNGRYAKKARELQQKM